MADITEIILCFHLWQSRHHYSSGNHAIITERLLLHCVYQRQDCRSAELRHTSFHTISQMDYTSSSDSVEHDVTIMVSKGANTLLALVLLPLQLSSVVLQSRLHNCKAQSPGVLALEAVEGVHQEHYECKQELKSETTIILPSLLKRISYKNRI